MTPFYFAQQRILLLAAIPVLVIGGGALFFHPISFSFGGGSSSAPAAYTSAASSTVYLSPEAATSAAQTTSAAQAPITEIHIANDGLTLLRGSRVTSTSGGALAVTLLVDGTAFNWSVHTAYGTQIMNSAGEKALITDVHVGDILTVTGQIDQGDGPAVTAQYIRDQSI